jgi:hypothetical protein
MAAESLAEDPAVVEASAKVAVEVSMVAGCREADSTVVAGPVATPAKN